ncbi:hypothetical protein L6164_031852 [Bauhinia variegata]|uniref:Uncharacterized protein n=1 Tax=Bauhinia variegata TaxID=167791 RepID=A0ACB9KLX4_BAUVA|nr:hypothetical protein L6164_031852 [Bauhinia variegata]
MTSTRKPQALKIVQIETRYIEIDAVNFRDVVQSLTGKDSTMDWVANHGSGAAKVAKPEEDGRAMILKNMSFKELEKLFAEMPPLDSFF